MCVGIIIMIIGFESGSVVGCMYDVVSCMFVCIVFNFVVLVYRLFYVLRKF